jgi:hypothetical protein
MPLTQQWRCHDNDAYNRWYEARAACAYAVTSHNRSDAGRCFLQIRAEAMFSVMRGPCRDYIREQGNGSSVQLSVGDSHGKFVVEEEIEVSL